MTDKNTFAPYPPMGWNSWDCYGASVNEAQVKANADFMAKNLKQYGWQYIVIDIQWSEPTADSTEYHPFANLCMDEYSRLIPAPNRFPSSAGGKGFAPIAEYVHALGLKFGIHVLRGIPRQAVHANTPIKYAGATARDAAQSYSICPWNTDMYGVRNNEIGQAYYDSILELYASWGVDYIKVDDLSVTEFKPHDPYSAAAEIEMIHNAIMKTGREIVFSLSPGPAPIDHAEHMTQYANMWRMTGDFWDNWPALNAMFEKCDAWARYVKPGCWPDCDMLPLGQLMVFNRPDSTTGRHTNFTNDEVCTMMTLWCIFRSPLMLGCEMTLLDDEMLQYITNDEILALEKTASHARQVMRTNDTVIWMSRGDTEGEYNVAFFNTSYSPINPTITINQLWIPNGEYSVRDLWKKEDIGTTNLRVSAAVAPHGAVCYKLKKI